MRPMAYSVMLWVQGTSLRLRSGQALVPVEHTVAVPMLTQAEQQGQFIEWFQRCVLADAAEKAARQAGVENVHLGNRHYLGRIP